MTNGETRQFDGKVALVTGGSAGIGKASAFAYAREGARVVICGRTRESGEETVQQITDAGGDVTYIQADISKASDVKTLIKETVNRYGRLDYALNNAGINPTFAPITDWDEETWDSVINTNLKGVWLCMKYEIPEIKKNGGAIVNMSSVFGMVGFPDASVYIASKSGVVGLTKSAALENAQSGIRINAICPGVVRTPLVDSLIEADPQVESQLSGLHPMGRMGTPEEIAEAVVWLSSAAASFVTGHTMIIDGGVFAQ